MAPLQHQMDVLYKPYCPLIIFLTVTVFVKFCIVSLLKSRLLQVLLRAITVFTFFHLPWYKAEIVASKFALFVFASLSLTSFKRNIGFIQRPWLGVVSDVTVYWHTPEYTCTSPQQGEKLNHRRSAKTSFSGWVKLLFNVVFTIKQSLPATCIRPTIRWVTLVHSPYGEEERL